MLTHPTLDKLQRLKFTGMATALAEQMQMPDIEELAFEERLGLLIDREVTERENRRLTSRLRRAKLKHQASLEDIDYRYPRGLDKSLIQSLAACRWVTEHLNILITGPTGVGKTWLACALAQKACREGYTALYLRKRSMRYRFESEAGLCWELRCRVSRVSFNNHSGCKIPGK